MAGPASVKVALQGEVVHSTILQLTPSLVTTTEFGVMPVAVMFRVISQLGLEAVPPMAQELKVEVILPVEYTYAVLVAITVLFGRRKS